MAEKLTVLFHCIWRMEAITQGFNDASIIYINGKEILKSGTATKESHS